MRECKESLAKTGYEAWQLRFKEMLGKSREIYKIVKYFGEGRMQGGKDVRNYETLGKKQNNHVQRTHKDACVSVGIHFLPKHGKELKSPESDHSSLGTSSRYL